MTKGAYYKYKTKKYYQKLGYDVTLSEFMFRTGKFFVKKDIFGSDVIAMNDKEIIFINSKFVGTKKSGYQAKSDGIKEFRKYRFPPSARAILAMWTKGAKHPVIVDAFQDNTAQDNSQETSQ